MGFSAVRVTLLGVPGGLEEGSLLCHHLTICDAGPRGGAHVFSWHLAGPVFTWPGGHLPALRFLCEARGLPAQRFLCEAISFVHGHP